MLSSSSIAISPFLSLACSLCVLLSFLIECSSKYIVSVLFLLSLSGYVKESVRQSSSRYYLRRLEQLTLGHDRQLVQPRVQATVLCLFVYAEGLLINQVGFVIGPSSKHRFNSRTGRRPILQHWFLFVMYKLLWCLELLLCIRKKKYYGGLTSYSFELFFTTPMMCLQRNTINRQSAKIASSCSSLLHLITYRENAFVFTKVLYSGSI